MSNETEHTGEHTDEYAVVPSAPAGAEHQAGDDPGTRTTPHPQDPTPTAGRAGPTALEPSRGPVDGGGGDGGDLGDLGGAVAVGRHDETDRYAEEPTAERRAEKTSGRGEPIDEPDDSVTVERDWPVSAVVGGVSGLIAVAYLLRVLSAPGSANLLDWLLTALTLALAIAFLAVVADSRAPLMLIDHHGVRIRRGRAWYGVSWPEVVRVEHIARTSLLHDGRLDVVDDAGRRFGARLSVSTRLSGADWHELDEALHDLSGARVRVVGEAEGSAVEPAPFDEARGGDPVDDVDGVAAGATLDGADRWAGLPTDRGAPPDPTDAGAERTACVGEPMDGPAPTPEPTPTPAPARALGGAVRSDRVLERDQDETAVSAVVTASVPEPTDLPTEAPFGRAGGSGATPVATSDAETVVVAAGDWPAPPPVADPVVGPVLAAARTRISLSVDQLSERTRIRPHVIEGIEVDDFTACGGDFYARGHLRTLARVLGVEAAPLLTDYDELYSDAPVDPRRVFEADLAAGGKGTLRATRGGLNWSILVAAVMAVVLVWSVARLVLDQPSPVSHGPVLNGSPGGGKAKLADAVTKVPVRLTAATGGARVVVRDGDGKTVFADQLPFEGTAALQVVPPVRVTSSDGGLQVQVDGKARGAVGATGQSARQIYVP